MQDLEDREKCCEILFNGYIMTIEYKKSASGVSYISCYDCNVEGEEASADPTLLRHSWQLMAAKGDRAIFPWGWGFTSMLIWA